jgi:hypothetical protein
LKQFIYRKSKISSSPPHRSPKKRYAVGSPKPGPPGKPVDRRQAVMKIALPGAGRVNMQKRATISSKGADYRTYFENALPVSNRSDTHSIAVALKQQFVSTSNS